MSHATTDRRSQAMEECIRNCTDCHEACLRTVAHCLERGGKHAAPAHIALLLSCADICATSANVMLLGSDVHKQTCAACAVICDRCAEDCEQLDPDDAQMRACAEVCRRCAESCRRMAA